MLGKNKPAEVVWQVEEAVQRSPKNKISPLDLNRSPTKLIMQFIAVAPRISNVICNYLYLQNTHI
jgi:hypothetical protein